MAFGVGKSAERRALRERRKERKVSGWMDGIELERADGAAAVEFGTKQSMANKSALPLATTPS